MLSFGSVKNSFTASLARDRCSVQHSQQKIVGTARPHLLSWILVELGLLPEQVLEDVHKNAALLQVPAKTKTNEKQIQSSEVGA